MVAVTEAEFESAVSDALDALPDEFARLLRNVVVLVEDESPAGEPELLGLYDGVPITERDSNWAGALPDRITLFRGPLSRMCTTIEELHREIQVTVVHEVAHYFGIDDDKLHELGWG